MKIKRFGKILLVIIAVLGVLWLTGRYGWRLAGFRACDGSGISGITVKENSVQICGFDPGSFPRGCVGTAAKQEGDVLYFGVRYDALFGFFERGTFDVTVPLRQPIRKIVLKTGSYEYVIWDAETDPAEMQNGFFR